MNGYTFRKKRNMAVKKKEEPPFTVSNVNNNTNNVNVKVELPKRPRKAPAPKQKKPNWLKRAIIIGLISLGVTLIAYFVQAHYDDQRGDAPSVHNNTPIQPN